MTSNEINIMAGGGHCHIRDLATGNYLHGTAGVVSFKPEMKTALVYHYVKDNVPEQLAIAKERFNADWEAVPIN